MTRIAIVDYNLGNLLNVHRALAAVGADSFITAAPTDLEAADAIVLPGVGAFAVGMENLKARGLAAAIAQAVAHNKPVLGICLGMQLLMDSSEEFGYCQGLGVVPGNVVHLQSREGGNRVKVPQIGWNCLHPPTAPDRPDYWRDSLLAGLEDNSYVYFLHSLYVVPSNREHVVAVTNYGWSRFASVIRKDNTFACQFHPEKSAGSGLRILANFVQFARQASHPEGAS